MAAYQTPLDIRNRALQHCRMARVRADGDSSPNNRETLFVYDKLRQAELRDNLWGFATRRAVLRAVDTVTAVLQTSGSTGSGLTLPFADTTGVALGQLVTGTNIASGSTVASFIVNTSVTLSLAITGTVASGAAITFGPLTFLWTPPTYSAGTTYSLGSVVLYTTGGDVLPEWWQSKVASNLDNTPAHGNYWARYAGPDDMQVWSTDVSYVSGELALGSNGTVYLSLITTNESHDPTTTTGFWLAVNGTATGLSILYPIGAGPHTDHRTYNVFRLPRGFLRRAPTAPTAGVSTMLGAPSGLWRDDWVFEGGYIISMSPDPLMLRYVADVIDVPNMDAEFCEMLAARIAQETAPTLAAPDALQVILGITQRHYASERRKAILANGIEIGPTDPPLDGYITARW